MVLKAAVLKIFAVIAEKYLWESLLKEVTLRRVSISFELRVPPNIIS